MGTVLAHLSRDRRLEVRLTAEEFAVLRDTAQVTGVSMADVVRMSLHTADRKSREVERAR
jgi:predicted DNA binding CopG/RHH family protein